MDEKKFILLDILEQEYTDDDGVKKPYFDIYIKKVHQNKVCRYRALNNTAFAKMLDEYCLLVGKDINPIFDSKPDKHGNEIAVIDTILAK